MTKTWTPNRLTKLATTAVAAVLSLGGLAPEAKAQQGGEALFVALDRAGVEVVIGQCEKDTSYGFYRSFVGRPDPGSIHICTNVATTEADRWETLRHEAVHAAQHCRSTDFDTVMTDSWIQQNHSRSDAQFIMQAYDRSQWVIELEAFTLEHAPNGFIAQLVTRNCSWRF